MKEDRGKTRVDLIKTPSYKEAEDILNNLHTGEYCMKQYTTKYIGEKEAGDADYSKLIHYRYVIREIAEKINKSKPNIGSIKEKIQEKPKHAQLRLF